MPASLHVDRSEADMRIGFLTIFALLLAAFSLTLLGCFAAAPDWIMRLCGQVFAVVPN